MLSYFRKRKLRKVVRGALADGVLSEAEASSISDAQRELRLDSAVVDEERVRHFNKAIAPILRRARSSRRLSDKDHGTLMWIAERQQVTPSFGSDLAIYRALWEIENTGAFEPKPINANLRLGRGEECYHTCEAIWAQVKKVRTHHGYVGASIGFRVAKGVTLRLGKAVPQITEHEELQDIDSGSLFITNKKIVFVGGRRSTNVTSGRIASTVLYSDAIEILKNSGKPDVFKLAKHDLEYVDALLQVI